MNQSRRWAVVGGGLLGCTLALRLREAGHDVTLFEAAPELGGLAGAWTIDAPGGPVVWDRHYHVTLLSDAHTRAILRELDLEDDMRWVVTRTGYLSAGRLSSASDAVEFLRLPGIGLAAKLRIGATILYASRRRDWRPLADVDVETWLRRLSGRRAFERFWRPQLRAKLGDSYQDVAASFLWATIQRLYAARRAGLKREMFGYVPGGYARIMDRFAAHLVARGVRLELGRPVSRVELDAAQVRLSRAGGDDERGGLFDEVVVTAAAPIASRLCPGLSAPERDRLDAVRYQGLVCLSLLLRRPPAGYYLTYLAEEAPFTTVVEMDALVDRRHFGGHSLVYLPRYARPDDPIFDASDEEIEGRFVGALCRLYPNLTPGDVLAARVSRVRHVFAVPTVGRAAERLPMATGLPGVHLVNSAQITNGTLNVDETVALAEEAAAELLRPGSPDTGRAGLAAVAAANGASGPFPPAAGSPRMMMKYGRDGARQGTGSSRDDQGPGAKPGVKAIASLSLDLDNEWSYLKTHGDAGWQAWPSFLDAVVPRVLDLLAERGLTITFFVVGQDAALDRNREALGALATAGHEIGNHSFSHEPWLHRATTAEVRDELSRAEEAIEGATGRRPAGFRGPGYTLSPEILRVLAERGYLYDCSTLPTVIGPLARAVYFRSARLDEAERKRRADLFGHAGEALRPLRPYRWAVGEDGIVEIPVTVLPGARVPIHVSYLLALAGRSPALARAYFRAALGWCRVLRVEPSILLHPLDFLGGDDVESLAFFPGMALPGGRKLELTASFLDVLAASHRVGTMSQHAAAAVARGPLPVVQPGRRRPGRGRPHGGDAGRSVAAGVVAGVPR